MKYTFVSIILFAILAAGCYKQDEYTKPFDGSEFDLLTTTETLPADGVSTTTIHAEIPADADDSFSQITFKTTAGLFSENNDKTYTAKAKKVTGTNVKRAEVTLRTSTKTENAIVSIELFEHKKIDTIQFIRAFPTGIQLTPSSFSIKPSNTSTGEITIEALVSRTPGIPSVGSLIDIAAYDANYITRPGSFRISQSSTNDQAKANFTYVLGDSVANNTPASYIGRLYIIGRTININNQVIADTIQIISSR